MLHDQGPKCPYAKNDVMGKTTGPNGGSTLFQKMICTVTETEHCYRRIVVMYVVVVVEYILGCQN